MELGEPGLCGWGSPAEAGRTLSPAPGEPSEAGDGNSPLRHKVRTILLLRIVREVGDGLNNRHMVHTTCPDKKDDPSVTLTRGSPRDPLGNI